MDGNRLTRRREFLGWGLGAGVGVTLLGVPKAFPAEEGSGPTGRRAEMAEIGPDEDLMREHGVVVRVLLIYEEVVHRIEAGKDFPATTVADAAGIVHHFIEDYHEKLEEEHLFPQFRRANVLVDLVDTLTAQHEAGRALTQWIESLTAEGAPTDPGSRERLSGAMVSFTRMYLPHLAREDTVLFPKFHQMLAPEAYGALGKQFEDRERQMFGAEGFETIVGRVAELEKSLGIYALERFTPDVTKLT